MNHKRLEKLRRRAFEAGIIGSSKMDETQLLEALAAVGRSSWLHALRGTRTGPAGRLTASR